VAESFATFHIVKQGKNESEPFSIGTQVNVTCQEGFRPNVFNGTARCKKGGVWKPDKPGCFLSESTNRVRIIRFCVTDDRGCSSISFICTEGIGADSILKNE
jgi:hypothetical protein